MSLFPFLYSFFFFFLEPMTLKQVASRQMPQCHLRDAHKTTRWVSNQDSTCQCRRRQLNPWVKKISWSRKPQPTLVFLPGKFHGQRSLAGQSIVSQRVRDDLARKQLRKVKKNLQIRVANQVDKWILKDKQFTNGQGRRGDSS